MKNIPAPFGAGMSVTLEHTLFLIFYFNVGIEFLEKSDEFSIIIDAGAYFSSITYYRHIT